MAVFMGAEADVYSDAVPPSKLSRRRSFSEAQDNGPDDGSLSLGMSEFSGIGKSITQGKRRCSVASTMDNGSEGTLSLAMSDLSSFDKSMSLAMSDFPSLDKSMTLSKALRAQDNASDGELSLAMSEFSNLDKSMILSKALRRCSFASTQVNGSEGTLSSSMADLFSLDKSVTMSWLSLSSNQADGVDGVPSLAMSDFCSLSKSLTISELAVHQEEVTPSGDSNESEGKWNTAVSKLPGLDKGAPISEFAAQDSRPKGVALSLAMPELITSDNGIPSPDSTIAEKETALAGNGNGVPRALDAWSRWEARRHLMKQERTRRKERFYGTGISLGEHSKGYCSSDCTRCCDMKIFTDFESPLAAA